MVGDFKTHLVELPHIVPGEPLRAAKPESFADEKSGTKSQPLERWCDVSDVRFVTIIERQHDQPVGNR